MAGQQGGPVEVPVDVQEALSATAGAMDTWNRLSDEDKRAHIASVEASPDDVARARCVETLAHDLAVQTPQGAGR